MKNENLEKLDQMLMDQFKETREKKVPWRIMNGFSASVERQILEKQLKTVPRFGFLKWGIAGLVPAFAALLFLASTALLHSPADIKTRQKTAASTASAISVASPSGPEISDEVTFLSELGEWNEEDEAEFN